MANISAIRSFPAQVAKVTQNFLADAKSTRNSSHPIINQVLANPYFAKIRKGIPQDAKSSHNTGDNIKHPKGGHKITITTTYALYKVDDKNINPEQKLWLDARYSFDEGYYETDPFFGDIDDPVRDGNKIISGFWITLGSNGDVKKVEPVTNAIMTPYHYDYDQKALHSIAVPNGNYTRLETYSEPMTVGISNPRDIHPIHTPIE